MTSYLDLKTEEIERRAGKLIERLKACDVCPINCQVDRLSDKIGPCGSGRLAKISSYNLHFGEERSLIGRGGSGTIFFAGCSLRCIFCQNYPISQMREGEFVSKEELSQMMVDLQNQGAHNINLVTPSHIVPQFVETLPLAISDGLSIPIVYNTSGFDDLNTLDSLDGIVDIYLPDMKYSDRSLGVNYSRVRYYPEVNLEAVKKMYAQVGDLVLEDGVAVSGVIIRHLVLPAEIENSKGVLKTIVEEISPTVTVSLLTQYYPSYKAVKHQTLNRPLNQDEVKEILDYVQMIGLRNVLFQNRVIVWARN